MTLQAAPPSFGGTEPLKVGRNTYGIVRGSKFVHVAGQRLCYVMGPDGKVHALIEAGEVEIPPDLQAAIRKKNFGVT